MGPQLVFEMLLARGWAAGSKGMVFTISDWKELLGWLEHVLFLTMSSSQLTKSIIFSIFWGNFIIPTDEVHHFSEGLGSTTNKNQPDNVRISLLSGIVSVKTNPLRSFLSALLWGTVQHWSSWTGPVSSQNWMMGKFTGNPYIFHGKNHGFRLRFSQQNQAIDSSIQAVHVSVKFQIPGMMIPKLTHIFAGLKPPTSPRSGLG